MKVKYSKKFAKQYDKASEKVHKAVENRLKLFLHDPRDSQLRNHALKGVFQGYRSIDITGDWRAIYSEEKEGDELIIIFEMLGTHSQLYR